ncbi:hypothetical protein EV361DRAFT_801566 [Lentinula raphanica]|nr:hypothetical protein FB446DRAFT_645829 [Lentinula raphanica]KAJ3970704.1 hypothetical protein EV361DRAFT_801566 [Lentinula raphanica]
MGSSTFHFKELQRALSEQALLIRTFSMEDHSSLEASASVTLLEGNVITIVLTNQGYRSDQSKEGPFETIEDLLQCVSPLYARKRRSTLLDALERLSSQQSPHEKDTTGGGLS